MEESGRAGRFRVITNLDEALAKTSLGRLVSADDIANAIVFLASPLGANISGHALPVDADTHALV